jgi:hypothetical protein
MDTHADALIHYLPVGSEQGARHSAEQALKAAADFVNHIPQCSSLRTLIGDIALRRLAFQSSAMTSRARWASPSRIGCWPACLRIAACASIAMTSSPAPLTIRGLTAAPESR